MEKNLSFEKNLENLDKIIEKLEEGNLSLDDSIKEYEKAMKLIKNSKNIIEKAEGKLLKVINAENKINIEDLEGDK